jgi:hypothetical protein
MNLGDNNDSKGLDLKEKISYFLLAPFYVAKGSSLPTTLMLYKEENKKRYHQIILYYNWRFTCLVNGVGSNCLSFLIKIKSELGIRESLWGFTHRYMAFLVRSIAPLWWVREK